MLGRSGVAFALAGLLSSTLASPTPVEHKEDAVQVAARQATTRRPILNLGQLGSVLSGAVDNLGNNVNSIVSGASAAAAILTEIVPGPGPSTVPELREDLRKIFNANPDDLLKSGSEITFTGLAGGDLRTIQQSYGVLNNQDNVNEREPEESIFPKAAPEDAPYSVSEEELRKVIYIPPGFTYGRIQPVILIPGLGALAGQNFGPNYGKQFRDGEIADPVYVNLPRNNLQDVQIAAEYAAYAVNYISGISGGANVSTLSWSQGSVIGQWGLKYWPSLRSKISNAIRISPDHHGTIEVPLLCPVDGVPGIACTPAAKQQGFDSDFINTLRADGGDSAYVPTTNVYSIFDEIIQPQVDPNASGALDDARNVGVSNTQVQTVCTPFLPGAAPYFSHAGTLYNPIGYALAVDALTHDGPGQLERLDLQQECSRFASPGLSMRELLLTEGLIPILLAGSLAYFPKAANEPAIMAYAQ